MAASCWRAADTARPWLRLRVLDIHRPALGDAGLLEDLVLHTWDIWDRIGRVRRDDDIRGPAAGQDRPEGRRDPGRPRLRRWVRRRFVLHREHRDAVPVVWRDRRHRSWPGVRLPGR